MTSVPSTSRKWCNAWQARIPRGWSGIDYLENKMLWIFIAEGIILLRFIETWRTGGPWIHLLSRKMSIIRLMKNWGKLWTLKWKLFMMKKRKGKAKIRGILLSIELKMGRDCLKLFRLIEMSWFLMFLERQRRVLHQLTKSIWMNILSLLWRIWGTTQLLWGSMRLTRLRSWTRRSIIISCITCQVRTRRCCVDRGTSSLLRQGVV